MTSHFTNPEAARQQMLAWGFGGQTFDKKQINYEDEPLYDQRSFAAGDPISESTTQFFRDQANKTLAQTNMTRQNELPAPEMFSIQAIGIYFRQTIHPTDMDTILNNFAFRLKVGRKEVITGPIWEYAAAAGAWYNGNGTGLGVTQNGVPSRESMKKLNVPVLVESGVFLGAYFSGTQQALQNAPTGTGATITVVLRGIYIKGVQ